MLWIRIHFKWIWIHAIDDRKLKKKYSRKFLFIFFWSKIAFYLSLGLYKGRPDYRRSLQLSNDNIQHFKSYFSILRCQCCGSASRSCLSFWYGSWPGSNPPIRIRICNTGFTQEYCAEFRLLFELTVSKIRFTYSSNYEANQIKLILSIIGIR